MNFITLDHPAEHVARLTLNRPERLNAMSIDLVLELGQALEDVAAENDTWVVILTGAGRAFSSGLDLKDHGMVPNIDGLQVGRIAQRAMRVYSQLIPQMRSIPQPIIAAINGVAFGGGMCLSLGADLRIASDTAVFNATGIVNGLTSTEMGVSYLLPRLIGAAHSNDLLLTGRRIDAEEAHRMGLVSRVTTEETLADLAIEIAADMARLSPYGLAMTKDLLWANLEVGSLAAAIELEDRNQLMLGFTNNLPEAIRAFGEERAPSFTDEPRHDIWPKPEDFSPVGE
ncbi:MAG: enoyl-CoA hydratase-related protein [Acidimicrobiia bacterium]